MIPFRSDYLFLGAMGALTVGSLVLGFEPWWIWLLFWGTLGAFLVYGTSRQLRLDLRFARGGKQAARDYHLDAPGDTAGTWPVSGSGPCMVYFTARRKGESFRLQITPPVIRMWVEDETENTIPVVDVGAVGAEPAMVREREHYYHGPRHGPRRRRPGPGGELYVPHTGPWRFNIRFVVRSPADKVSRVVLQVRVWGRVRDLRLADAPEVHEVAPAA